MFVPVMMHHVMEARFYEPSPPPKVDVSERRSSKKNIYFTKTHGLLVESLEQAIMNIRVVAQSTHPKD